MGLTVDFVITYSPGKHVHLEPMYFSNWKLCTRFTSNAWHTKDWSIQAADIWAVCMFVYVCAYIYHGLAKHSQFYHCITEYYFPSHFYNMFSKSYIPSCNLVILSWLGTNGNSGRYFSTISGHIEGSSLLHYNVKFDKIKTIFSWNRSRIWGNLLILMDFRKLRLFQEIGNIWKHLPQTPKE